MNNVCLATQVAVLFKRLVHVVSTVSVVQQYHSYKRNGSTTEHSSSQPAIELQDLSLGQAILNADRSSTVPRVLADQWDRIRGKTLWESWRSSPVQVQQSQQQPTFISLALLLWFRPTRPHSTPPNPLTPSGQAPREHPNVCSKPQPLGPEPDSPAPRRTEEPKEDAIKKLMFSPTLFDPMRAPRYPIVLCHGLYGFDVRGPSSFPWLQQHYWHNILNILRGKVGAEVIVTSVPSTGSIASRAETLHNLLQNKAIGRGVNFIGHSMGGLDCRHLISHYNPTKYSPLSLTTVGTPHRGSPFMDWCQENIGLGKMEVGSSAERELSSKLKVMGEVETERVKEDNFKSSKPSVLSFASLPSSFTTYLLAMLDSPAYANLTTKYLTEVFNPMTPDNPDVKYFSIAGRCEGVNIWHPLWLPKLVLDGYESKLREQPDPPSRRNPDWQWGNDCLVSVESAKWGEFLGVLEGCDHWAMRGASVLDLNYDLSSVSASIPSLPGIKLSGGNGKDGEWSLLDWGKFVRLWRTEESKRMVSDQKRSTVIERDRLSVKDAQEREDALKTSTDKVSAMLDWIVDQVPLTSKEKGDIKVVEKEESRKRDIANKEGLERLYVALSKKLYDEGL